MHTVSVSLFYLYEVQNDAFDPEELIGGELAEDWLEAQRDGFSNRLIRRFGAHYAVLKFERPADAPKHVLNWRSGRKFDRFVPHHKWESEWVYIEDTQVEFAGSMVQLVSALLQWHNPPQLSDDRLTKWVSRWQLCMSATLVVGSFEVIETRDLLSVTTGAVLTDGCGRISCGLADLIADNNRKTHSNIRRSACSVLFKSALAAQGDAYHRKSVGT